MSKLLAVGTVAFDAIETPFGKTDKILGGSGTFVGLAAAQFGVQTGVVSVVGGDFPQDYLDMMNARGINTDGVEVVPDGKTFFWSGKYHNDMNSRDTLVTELNVLADFDHRRVFDAGDNLDSAAAFPAGLDVDIENPLQALRPAHRGAAFGRGLLLQVIHGFRLVAPLYRSDRRSVLAVRRKHTMESGEIDTRLRHQGGQSSSGLI